MRSLLLGIMLIAAGCGHKQLSPEDFIRYIDHDARGLIAKETVGDFTVSASYRPWQYEMIRSVGTSDRAALEQALGREDSMQYILLRIESADQKKDVLTLGVADEEEYHKRAAYLTASVQDDIVLVDGNDTLPCIGHHWEQSYGLTHFTSVLFAFESRHPGAGTDKIVVLQDRLFGMGRVRFRIDGRAVQSIPSIIR
jgi:hypothetical protein